MSEFFWTFSALKEIAGLMDDCMLLQVEKLLVTHETQFLLSLVTMVCQVFRKVTFIISAAASWAWYLQEQHKSIQKTLGGPHR